MSKCGKGCMPECEYFTTSGCISPFNCMYKEESGYINSATSGSIIYGTMVARWIWDAKDNVTKCSMCGKSALYIREKDIHSTFREHYSPYCPHCGAKMELTSEDDNG